MLYSLRVLSTALDEPEYATFIVFVGLIGWFSLSDFGLGYAVQNAVTKQQAKGEFAFAEIFTAYLIVSASTVLVVFVLFLFKSQLAYLLFSKITQDEVILNGNTFIAVTSLLAVSGMAAMSTKILYAMHRGYVANTATAFGSLFGVGFLMVGVENASNKVLFAIFALYGPSILINLAFCGRQFFQALQKRIGISWQTVSSLLISGKGFFIFYFMAAVVLQIDYLIMSQKVLPHEIVHYFMVAKIFSLISFVNQAVLFATWPRMTAIYEVGDRRELPKLIRKLVVISMLTTVSATIFVLALRDPLSKLLSPGSTTELRATVVIGFGAIALLRCLADPFAIFLQSINKMKPLVLFAAAQAVIGGCLQLLLVGTLGIEGILLALVISFILTVTWGLPLVTIRLLKQS